MRRERGEHMLQTSALVHEAYSRLCGAAPTQWHDRAHFFAVAAQQLRRVLVDMRGASAAKNAAAARSVQLCSMRTTPCGSLTSDCWLSMELYTIETLDRRAAKVIELRFFGGLTETEAA